METGSERLTAFGGLMKKKCFLHLLHKHAHTVGFHPKNTYTK